MKTRNFLQENVQNKRDQLQDALLDGDQKEKFRKNEVLILSIYEQLKSGQNEFYLNVNHIERIKEHLSDQKPDVTYDKNYNGFLDFDEFYLLLTQQISPKEELRKLYEQKGFSEELIRTKAYSMIYHELIEQDLDKGKCCSCWKSCLKSLARQRYPFKFTKKCCILSTKRQDNMQERLIKMRKLYPAKEDLNSMVIDCPSQYDLIIDAVRGILPVQDFISDFFFVMMIYYTYVQERKSRMAYNQDASPLSSDDADLYEEPLQSRENEKTNYFIVLLVSLISTTTPIMFMLSCMFVVKFSQGDYNDNHWKDYNMLKKFFHCALLSVYGYIVMFLVFIIQVLMKICLLFSACLGQKKYIQTENKFRWLLKLISGLQLYQIRQLEQSTKVSQALFEDLPQGILMIMIFTGHIKCPGLTDSKDVNSDIDLGVVIIEKFTYIKFTFALCCLNIVYIIYTIKTESETLKEPMLIYLQTRLTANNKWFPLVDQFQTQELKENVSFSDVKVETPFTNLDGSVNWIEFQFVDSTLQNLLDNLLLWKDKDKSILDGTREKRMLIFNEKCLERVTLNMIVHFIANFPHELFDLELKLDMDTLYDKKLNQDNKINFQKTTYEQIKGKYNVNGYSYKTIMTVTGHSALNLCMRDEKNKTKNWFLRPIFERMIYESHYDQYDQGPLHPFNQALQHDCIQSLKFMTSQQEQRYTQNEKSSFIPIKFHKCTTQIVNRESFLGALVKKIANIDLDHKNLDEYVNLLAKVAENIDFNQELILHKKSGRMTTLVEYFAKRVSKAGECHNKTGELMLFNKYQDTKLRANSHTEKLTVVKETVRFIARYNNAFKCHIRAMKALSKLCEESDIDIVKFQTTDKDDNISFPMVEYLMRDWSRDSFNQFNDTLEKSFTSLKYTKSRRKKDPLKRLIETINQSKEAQKYLFKNKSYFIIKAILQHNIVKFDQNLLDSAIKFAKDELQQNQYSEFSKLIQPNLEESLSQQDVLTILNEQTNNLNIQARASFSQVSQFQQDLMKQMSVKTDFSDTLEHRNLAYQVISKATQRRSLKVTKSDEQNMWMRYNDANKGHDCIPEGYSETPDNSKNKILEKLRKKERGRTIREVVMLFTEVLAAADLVTDLFILLDLLRSEHIAWSSLTIFSMLAPFFICHIPYLSFLTQKFKKTPSEKRSLKERIYGFIMVTPLMVIFLFIMDLWFLIFTVVAQTIYIFTLKICSGMKSPKMEKFIDLIDQSYLSLFFMQKFDVSGFRRMRTISQLTFESSLQIFLQIRIYLFLIDSEHQLWDRGDFNHANFEVDTRQISQSIVIALFHAAFELFFIYLEAKVSKTTFLNYVIVCFNGRYGWVPYQEYLSIQSKKLKNKQKLISKQEEQPEKLNTNNDQERIELNFGDISEDFVISKMLNMSMMLTLDFDFTDDSISSFANELGTFPIQDQERNMPMITFNKAKDNISLEHQESPLDEISLENLESLLSLSANRVCINLEGVNLEKIFLKSSYKNLLELSDPNDQNYKLEKAFFIRLLKKKNYQLIRYLLEVNPSLMKTQIQEEINNKQFSRTFQQQEDIEKQQQPPASKQQENLEQQQQPSINLAELVYKTNDAKLLEILVQQNSNEFNNWLGELKGDQRQTLTFKLLMLQNYEIWEAFANNSDIITGSLLQELLLIYDHFVNEDKSKFDASQKFWHTRFGNGCPREWSCKLGVQFIKAYKEAYPDEVYFFHRFSKNQTIIHLRFQTKDAFKFAVLRRILVQEWNIDKNGPLKSGNTAGMSQDHAIDLRKHFRKIQDIKNIKRKKKFLQDLSLIMMIMSEELHSKVGNLTTNQVLRLDKVVELLMLDTNQWLYFARTRLNDQSGHTIRCKFYGRDVYMPSNESHQVYAGYPKDFSNDNFINCLNFSPSLKVQLSNNALAVLKQSYEFEPTDKKTLILLGCFIKNQNHSFFSDLLQNDSADQPTSLDFDSQEWAQVDLDRRLQDFQLSRAQARTMSAVQSLKGNSEIKFCTYSNGLNVPQIRNFVVDMDITFQIGTNMALEERILQKQCMDFQEQWEKSKYREKSQNDQPFKQIQIPSMIPSLTPEVSTPIEIVTWNCPVCEYDNDVEDNPEICGCCDEPRPQN